MNSNIVALAKRRLNNFRIAMDAAHSAFQVSGSFEDFSAYHSCKRAFENAREEFVFIKEFAAFESAEFVTA